METTDYKYIKKNILLESGLICLHHCDVKIIVVGLTITN